MVLQTILEMETLLCLYHSSLLKVQGSILNRESLELVLVRPKIENKLRLQDSESEASLGYTVRLYLTNTKKANIITIIDSKSPSFPESSSWVIDSTWVQCG